MGKKRLKNTSELVLKYHNEGIFDIDSAKLLGITPQAVNYHKKKLGLPSNNYIPLLKHSDEIIEHFKNNGSTYSLMKKLNCDRSSINSFNKHYKIITKSKKEIDDDRRVVKTNPFNGSKESNYWLGLLAADGSIYNNRISLSLKESDLEHVEKFKKFIGYDIPIIKVSKTINNNIFYAYRAYFRSKLIASYLNELGITENKSMTIEYYGILTRDFLRGLIDGDGFIRKNGDEVSIVTGSINFANQLTEYIKKEFNINCTSAKKVKNIYRIGVYGKKQVYKLLSIYKDADIYLERKYQNAISIRNNREIMP